MGVVNVTPDSFSDGGQFLDPANAITHGKALYEAGADILDIGGELTRPGADPVSPQEEVRRVVPVIEGLKGLSVPLSIDTRHADVMQAALQAGASLLNDVSALTHDPNSMAVAAGSDVPVILMHAQGTPQTMQDDPHYEDVVAEVTAYLQGRVDACMEAGIDASRLILDPGIGFGKTFDHNIALMAGLGELVSLGHPVLLGASRKRFIGALTGVDVAEDRVSGSVAAALAGIAQGVHIVRVHDVAETCQAIAVWQAIENTREKTS